jgi:nucleotide-binding universal stress UspA family protein
MWTFPPARILVPVDFGPTSKHAARVAGALAHQFNARGRALHAEMLEAPPYFTHEQIGAIERQRIAARTAAEGYVARFVAGLFPAPAEVRVVEAPPAGAILEAARAADLVVMGTHGRRGPSRWWLGSVAERVVRETPAPVLVVHAGHDPTDPTAIFRRPLMVASAHTFPEQAARYADGLARAFGGAAAPAAVACEADLAREQAATMMVVAKRAGGSTWFGDSAERLLRSCTLPMLFVPADRSG